MITNVLRLKLNGEEADRNWSVFEMVDGKADAFASPLSIDLPSAPFQIAGVAYCAQPIRRVLVATDPTVTKSVLLAFARKKGLDVTCRQLSWAALAASSERDCIRLLWAMLGQKDGCQNVAGKLFVNVPDKSAWNGRYVGDKKKKDARAEAVFMEVCIGNACELTLMVRSFTKKNLLYEELKLWRFARDEKKNDEQKQKRQEILDSLTRYKISGSRSLLAARGADDREDVYLQRKLMAVQSLRNTVDYNSHIASKRAATKIGVLMDLLSLFHAFHHPYAQLEFKEMSETGRIKTYKPPLKAVRAKEAALPTTGTFLEWKDDELPIRLVAAVGCEHLMRSMGDYLTLRGIPTSNEEGRLSICCIPREETIKQEEEDDPYAKLSAFPTQHVTDTIFESISYKRGMTHEPTNISSWPGLETCLKELRIKGDIDLGRIRLYDWETRGPDETVAFASISDFDSDGRPVSYCLVKVSPRGGMSFETADNAYCGEDPFINSALSALQTEKQGAWCCVSLDNGTVVGTETSLTTMPNIDAMRDYLRRTTTGEDVSTERSAETLMALYGDTFDIAWAEEPEGFSALYYAADCHNANYKRARATRLRRVSTLDGSPIAPWMGLLMPMLDVWFVKMRESTVRPFPLKYLEEWLNRETQARKLETAESAKAAFYTS